MKLHHVGIRCNDSSVSAHFYVQMFNAQVLAVVDDFMPLSRQREPGLRQLVDIIVDNVRLHLFDVNDLADRQESNSSKIGLQHICFVVESFPELLNYVQRYRNLIHAESQQQSTPRREASSFQLRPDGTIVCYIFDPDGNEIELISQAPVASVNELTLRAAAPADLPQLEIIIEEAYRQSDRGWTTEKDLVSGRRMEPAELESLVRHPGDSGTLLVCAENETIHGCIFSSKNNTDTGYFGLFAVNPAEQGRGIGKQLLQFAEKWIAEVFNCQKIHAQVLESRRELIDYYERRGYAISEQRTPFCSPENLLKPVQFVSIIKTLVQ